MNIELPTVAIPAATQHMLVFGLAYVLVAVIAVIIVVKALPPLIRTWVARARERTNAARERTLAARSHAEQAALNLHEARQLSEQRVAALKVALANIENGTNLDLTNLLMLEEVLARVAPGLLESWRAHLSTAGTYSVTKMTLPHYVQLLARQGGQSPPTTL